MTDKKRVTATEREALMRLGLALDFVDGEAKDLTARTRMIPRGAFWLGAAKVALERYMDAVYKTIPQEQLRIIYRSLKETTFTVGIKCSATASVRRFSEWGVVVPMEVMNVLFTACQDHCLACLGTTEDQMRCALRKALDTIPNDVEDRRDGLCPYRTIL